MPKNADGLGAVEPMSMEQYLQTHFRPDRDYINGAARERNVGFWPHSEVMAIVGGMLSNIARVNDMTALMSVRMCVDDHTIMVPDLTIIPRSQRKESILVTPPILSVEIQDVRDTILELQQRVDRYFAMGVKNIWVIDPAKHVGYYASSGGLDKCIDGVMKVSETEITVSLTEVFEELDKS